MTEEKNISNKTLLRQYAGMATQFLVSIGIAVFIGYKADGWLKIGIPLLVWLLPLLTILGMIFRVAKDTRRRKNLGKDINIDK